MPIFDYKCTKCGRKQEIYYREERKFKCPTCDIELVKIMPAPRVFNDYEPYNCPITGQLISGKQEHERNLRKHGCRILEPGEREEAARQRAQEDRELENKLCDTIAREVEKLPPAKQEALAKELTN